jgi:putative peptide zinc metalloprotease protein
LEAKLARNNPVDYEELQSTRAELAGLKEVKDKLTVRATFDGRVQDLSDVVRPGEWLAKDEPLGIVKNPIAAVTAYVEEADLAKLSIDGIGRFYPDGGDFSPFPVKISSIDGTGTRELKTAELASVYGGGVAVRPDKENEQQQLVPEQGIYRVLMQTDAPDLNYDSTVRGRLSLTTAPESIAGWLLRISIVALVKESGW